MLAQLVVERARETDLAELGGAVDGLAGEPAAARLRGDRDDVALRARDQVGNAGADRVDRPFQVDVDHLLDVLDGRVRESVVRADTGVRDADVEATEALDGLRDGAST